MKAGGPSGAKTALAYNHVKRRILEGTYSPGYRLVLEQISREASVSTVPVREALRRLEAEGYVVYNHNAGARVAELDAASYDAIQQVIAVLEGAATASAAPFVTGEALAQAKVLNEEMRRCRELFDAEGFMELNGKFHDLLCGPCQNERLLELLNGERSRMSILRQPTLGIILRLAEQFIDDHDRLIALIAVDPYSTDIQMLAQAHKQRILEAVRSATATAQTKGGKEELVGQV
ncbi:GntR family transcriptional regulator [Arthrobacter globiformis]|uniref:GntR family transcriptional regulator n=1 Tax=Arthrobacter globiformis TaxID=1665 RepID=UPI002785ACCD|nr:GntR family transcriptional regulator [Arthrobacter globiformis]MDQ0867310.1 DNA-binding GntR family transcriptional regulator [Arthrobacter globiformis]